MSSSADEIPGTLIMTILQRERARYSGSPLWVMIQGLGKSGPFQESGAKLAAEFTISGIEVDAHSEVAQGQSDFQCPAATAERIEDDSSRRTTSLDA